MIVRLVFFATLLTFTLSAVPNSPPPSLVHCECRCCTRTHFQTICNDTPHIVPLSAGYVCDTRIPTYHNPTVCGVALCRSHFADICPPPAFLKHSCVSDRGAFSDWAPLVFVSLALILAAYAASVIAARVPANQIKTGYIRTDGSEPAPEVSQPLVSASSLAASYGVQVLDLSPRRAATMPLSPPMRSLQDPYRVNTFPLDQRQTQAAFGNPVVQHVQETDRLAPNGFAPGDSTDGDPILVNEKP